jgi:hypothetical protein
MFAGRATPIMASPCASDAPAREAGSAIQLQRIPMSRIMDSIRSNTPRRPFPSGWLVAALLMASGVLWAVMFFGPLAYLAQLAGGAAPFDVRPFGYSFDEARAFLSAIGAQGRYFYGHRELPLDMLYPPLYAVSRGLALWWLTMPGRVREAPLPRRWRYALIAVPVVMASLDMIENLCIARMLSAWPALSPGLVQISSLATRAKIVAGALTELSMAVLAVLWLKRRMAGRRRRQ